MIKVEQKDDGSVVVIGEVPCGSCQGTGLYKGMCERDGAAVICYHCEGKGFVTVRETFKPFTKRKTRKDVTRVYETSGGYVISDKDVNVKEDNITIHFSQFGCSYEDWLNGKKPKPIEEIHCPYQHTSQALQSKDKNDLYKNYCTKYLGRGLISECKHNKKKHICWQVYNGKA